MDIIMLLIIITVIKSVIDSQKAKDNSKSRDAQRQGSQTRPPEHREPAATPRPPKGKQTAQPGGLEEIFGQMMGKMKESLAPETEQAKPQKSAASQTKKKKASANDPAKAKAKGKSQPKPQAQTVAASHQERQERSEHERLRPSVKPVKSVFEEQDGCGHRVELNPHIDYSKSHAQKQQNRVAIQVRHDEDTILQSIIWAEILAKPKALENIERYTQR